MPNQKRDNKKGAKNSELPNVNNSKGVPKKKNQRKNGQVHKTLEQLGRDAEAAMDPLERQIEKDEDLWASLLHKAVKQWTCSHMPAGDEDSDSDEEDSDSDEEEDSVDLPKREVQVQKYSLVRTWSNHPPTSSLPPAWYEDYDSEDEGKDYPEDPSSSSYDSEREEYFGS